MKRQGVEQEMGTWRRTGRGPRPAFVGRFFSRRKPPPGQVSPGADLQELARIFGIQPSMEDMTGRHRETPPETLRALLRLWGIETRRSSQVQHALRDYHRRYWLRAVDPVIVAWDGRRLNTPVRLPAGAGTGCASGQLILEDGRVWSVELPDGGRSSERATLDGEAYEARRVRLPELPIGYHELKVECAGRLSRALIISAPTRSYSPPEAVKRWGLFLPLYAAHSSRSWGAGNLADWDRFATWASAQGAQLLGTLPLLSTFLSRPVCEPSPYSPVSRLFWSEFYLDLTRVPEFKSCPRARRLVGSATFRARTDQFRASDHIDYEAEMGLRRSVLQELARAFFRAPAPRRLRDFQRFLSQRHEVENYASFRAVCDQTGRSWHTWEPRLKYGKIQPGDYLGADRQYHLYAQWLADEQMTELTESFRRKHLDLYLDLPLGVHPAGYDAWRRQDLFAFPAAVGAPPDVFFSKGQNWGFAPMHPQVIREQGYRYVRDYLEFQMRHASLLRIDHVMGLHRLYWIPPGFPATAGAYVHYPAEEMYAILSLESHRHKTVLVGENLGTVPPEVNQAMERHGLRRMFVLQFEQQDHPTRALPSPPRQAVASVNTHDTPTFTAHWEGLDLNDRLDLGLLSREELALEGERRRALNRALAAFLQRKGLLSARNSAAVLRACLQHLAGGPAEILLVNIEDLLSEVRPQNVPGTSVERPNWRRKMRLTLEELERSGEIRQFLRDLARRRR